MAKASRKKRLDFTGVETFNKPAEGAHKCKITKVEETSSQGGNDMFKVTFEVVSGPSKGCRVIENYPLIDTALWKLKSLLQAIGMKADGRVQVDLDKMEGKILEIEVYYEEYNGQDRAKISETRKYIDSSDDTEDEEDDIEEDEEEDAEEEEAPKKTRKTTTKTRKTASKKTTKKKEPEPEEEEDEDDDWDEDDDDNWDEE